MVAYQVGKPIVWEHLTSKQIIAFDPGEKTGVAIFYPRNREWKWRLLDLWGKDHFSDRLFIDLEIARAGLVIWETYRLYAHKAQQQSWSTMKPSQVVGMIYGDVVMHGKPWIEQSAMQGKHLFSNEILRKVGLYDQIPHRANGKNFDHCLDATRHLLYALWNHKHEYALQLLEGVIP